MDQLKNKKCVPCESGGQPLSTLEVDSFREQLNEEWEVVEKGKKLKRRFTFTDFAEALAFINQVAKLAEAEGHHPDLHLFYNLLDVELWTHAVDGLSENDFILAAKIDDLITK